jgi:hypothetical protein
MRNISPMQSALATLLGRTPAVTVRIRSVAPSARAFPLLVKFLDVLQMLSVQVHPATTRPTRSRRTTPAGPRPGWCLTPIRRAGFFPPAHEECFPRGSARFDRVRRARTTVGLGPSNSRSQSRSGYPLEPVVRHPLTPGLLKTHFRVVTPQARSNDRVAVKLKPPSRPLSRGSTKRVHPKPTSRRRAGLLQCLQWAYPHPLRRST